MGIARKAVIAALVFGLIGALAPLTQAGKKIVIVRNYTAPGGTTAAEYPNVFTQDVSGAESFGGAIAYTEGKENRVRIVAEDATGLPAAMRVFVVRDGKPNATPILLCDGQTEAPLKFQPGSGIQVFMVAGECNGAPAAPTRGTLTFTFSRK
jgi:hypothetical protein